MLWGTGATVGGSSGSPLIDVASRKVVGVLTGGYSSCYDHQGDYYGRLSAVGRWEPPSWLLGIPAPRTPLVT